MPPKRARKPKKKSTNKLSQSQTVIINRGGGGKKKGGTQTVASKPQQPINISHVTHVYNDRKIETKTTEPPTPTPTPAPAPSPFSGMSYTSSPFSYTSTLPSDFSIRQESQPFASYGYGGMRRRQLPTGGGGEGVTEPIIEEPIESSPPSRITRIEDITQPTIRIPQQLPPFSNLPQFPTIQRDIFQSIQQANDSQSVMQPLILPDEPMQHLPDEPMQQIEDAPRKDLRDDAEQVQQALLNEYSSPVKPLPPSPPPPPPPPRGRGRPVEPISEEDINILDRYVRGLSIPSRNRTEQQKDDVLRGSRLKHNKRQHPDLKEILNGLHQIYFP